MTPRGVLLESGGRLGHQQTTRPGCRLSSGGEMVGDREDLETKPAAHCWGAQCQDRV